jgi:sulfate permease, SulP family
LQTLLIGGVASLGFLFWVRRGLKPLLRGWAWPAPGRHAGQGGAGGAIAMDDAGRVGLGWTAAGVAVVGAVPQSLPPFTLPSV